MDALEIIARVQATYRECSSYRDKGVVSRIAEDGQRHDIEFETYFARPDWFRIDWIRPHPSSDAGPAVRHWFTIRCNGPLASARYLWVRDSGNKKQLISDSVLSLPVAVAAGSTTSHGVVAWIYQLLLPAGGCTETDLFSEGSELMSQTAVRDSTDCYVLRGNCSAGDLELWVDREQFVIRRALIRAGQTVHQDMCVHACALDESIDPQTFD
jgi:outer membrane lipoprotein-sorting protein